MSALKARIWGSGFLATLFIPFAVLADAKEGFTNGGGIPCISQMFTGYPCPGCGLTRAFASLTNFDLIASIRYNPEAILFTLLAVIAVISPSYFLKSRERISSAIAATTTKKNLAIGVSIFITLWVLNIIRVSTGFYPAS